MNLCLFRRGWPADQSAFAFADSIESTGAYKPEELFPEAIKVMQDKISAVESCLKKAFPNHVPRSD